jgi:hypothetical protein
MWFFCSCQKWKQRDKKKTKNKEIKRFDKILPNCLICLETIEEKVHVCCNICDIRMLVKCDKKYNESKTSENKCPHCRQERTLTVCVSNNI